MAPTDDTTTPTSSILSSTWFRSGTSVALSDGCYRRVKVTWVTPLGELTDSTSKR